VRLFETVAGLRAELACHWQGKKLGLVPTMGALHAGHRHLISRAVAENEGAIVSIFVNPLQFEPGSDWERYPRSLAQDCEVCQQLGVDLVFAPTARDLYGEKVAAEPAAHSDGLTQIVPPSGMLAVMCGPVRAGHFEGVATVVTKLLNIVRPSVAYFGQKDAQQLAIVRRLVADLNLPVEIRACPIIREPSGLAVSSRNQYLSERQQAQASALAQSLQRARQRFEQGTETRSALVREVRQALAGVTELELEYVELVHPDTLVPLERVETRGLLGVAARIGDTRLIDNVVLWQRQPIVAIDGPAGAGKSTVTWRVAERLGLAYLDTGAMYRALTWLVGRSNAAIDDEPAIAELASQAQIQLIAAGEAASPVRVWVDGQDVTEAIRSPEVTARVSAVAAHPAARHELVKQQRQWGEKGGFVAEGRDMGTYVFPDAELKIYLTASVSERARRRLQDLKAQGSADTVTQAQLEGDIQQRDAYDRNRQVAPLQQAADAIEIATDSLSAEAAADRIAQLYCERVGKATV